MPAKDSAPRHTLAASPLLFAGSSLARYSAVCALRANASVSSLLSRDHPSLQRQPLAALDFALVWRLIRLTLPQIGFVYLGPCFCLRLPSDSASRRTSLPLANGRRSPAPVRDSHPRDDAHCWAYTTQKGRPKVCLFAVLVYGAYTRH